MHNLNSSQCKIPITSNGIIHVNRQGKYLMICRKNTLGYVDIVRGRYSVYNQAYLKNLVDELTVQEKETLLQKPAADVCSVRYNVINGSKLASLGTAARMRSRYCLASSVETIGGTKFGMMIARANRRAECGTTSRISSPSRTCK